jgi:hypothetical protein
MPSRKVADAHILFSAQGLAALEKDAKGSIDRILGILDRADSTKGPLNNALLSDLGLLKEMNRAVSLLIANQRKLQSSSKGPNAAISRNIADAMSSDRERQVSRTRAFAQYQTAGKQVEAAAASPALLEAMGKVSKETEEYAAALKLSRTLTDPQKSAIRGDLRDLAGAGLRADASLGRQEGRDFLAADPSAIMSRRLSEIESNRDLSDIGKSQETSLAAQEIASALRAAAKGVREAGVDKAMKLAAKKLAEGAITPEQFLSDVARADATRRGTTSAQETLRDVDFRSRNAGQTEGDVTQEAELNALRNRSKKIQELIDDENNLDAEEKKRLATEKKLLDSTVTLRDADFKLSKEMKRHEDNLRKRAASRSALAIKEAKGIQLKRAEKQELKGLNAQMDREFAALNKLKVAQSGMNERLHKGSLSSKRFNFMMQQASYGVQDFVQVIGQTGLSGALRASANNMASLAAATGTVGGAVTGALGTILMIGLADAFQGMGNEAETTAKKMDRLSKSIGRMARAREGSRKLSEDLFGGATGDFKGGIEGIRRGLSGSSQDAAELKTSRHKAEELAASIFEASDISTPEPGFWKERGDAMVDVFGKIWSAAKTQFTFDLSRIIKEKRNEESGVSAPGSAMKELARQGLGLRGTNREERQGTHREIEREYERIKNTIVGADLSTIEGQLNVAEALGADVELIQNARDEIEAASDRLEEEKRRQAKALKKFQDTLKEYVDESALLMRFKSFSEGMGDASSIASSISDTQSRISVAQDRLRNTTGPEAESAQLALNQERAILKGLMDAFRRITEEALKLPSGLSDFSTSLQGIRSELAEKVRALEKAGVLTPEIYKRLMDESIQKAEALAEGHSGRASRRFGENQRQANDRVRGEIASQRVPGGSSLDAVFDMILKKMDEFERDFMKIAPDRSGISGRLASGVDTFERRRDEREKVLGPDARFDKENMSDVMRQMSDSIMSFSGKVERKLGETQEEANEREKRRLDDLIAKVTASADTDDDSLIPFFELTKRKIDEAGKKDLQAAAGATSIESLHDTIQNSLTGDTKEFDLQVEQRDLLKKINEEVNQFNNPGNAGLFEGLASNTDSENNPFTGEGGLFTPEDPLVSNVNTDSAAQTAEAADESLKYQQASSETLSEMLTFFKSRANSGGLVIS